MKRIDLYKLILSSVNVEIGNSDQLVVKKGDVEDPVIYDGKGFYLPTKANLAKSSAETADYLFFDPLTESAVRQESESTRMLKQLMMSRLQLSASLLVTNLLMILRDENNASLAKGNQTLLYRQGFNPSTTTMRSFTNVLRNGVKDSVTNRLVNIFLKRGGTIDGERFSRVAKVSFPILDAFNNTSNAIFGVEMSARDKENILKLFSYIVYGTTEPMADDDNEFSAGSNSKMAPYFQAMCFAYCNIARRLNRINKLYMKLYDSKKESNIADRIHIDLAFEEHVQELNLFKKDPMPLLPGNSGTVKQTHSDKEAEEQISDPVAESTPEQNATKGTRIETKPRVNQSVPQVENTKVEPRVLSGKQFVSQEPEEYVTAPSAQTSRPVIHNVVSQPPVRQFANPVLQNQTVGYPLQQQFVPQGQVQNNMVYYDMYGNPIDPRSVPLQNMQYQQLMLQYNNGYPQVGYQQPGNQYVSPRLAQANRVRGGYAQQPNPQAVNRYTGQPKTTQGIQQFVPQGQIPNNNVYYDAYGNPISVPQGQNYPYPNYPNRGY